MIQLLNGMSYGFLLFLLSSGLTLMYGLMNIINLAHGSYFMFGAYIGLSVAKATGNFFLAAFSGGAAVGMIGIAMERFLIRRFYKEILGQVLLTFGFVYIFMDLCQWVWGGYPLSLPTPSILSGSVKIKDMFFPVYRLIVIAVGFMVALGLWLFQEKTRVGSIIRAGVEDRQMVTGLGINIGIIFTLVFFLGAFLAGFAGVVGAVLRGVYPGIDLEILVSALAVIVVGGLGSLSGALLGAILIGLVETFIRAYFPGFAMSAVFMMMVIVLIVRPSGLLGKRM